MKRRGFLKLLSVSAVGFYTPLSVSGSAAKITAIDHINIIRLKLYIEKALHQFGNYHRLEMWNNDTHMSLTCMIKRFLEDLKLRKACENWTLKFDIVDDGCTYIIGLDLKHPTINHMTINYNIGYVKRSSIDQFVDQVADGCRKKYEHISDETVALAFG